MRISHLVVHLSSILVRFPRDEEEVLGFVSRTAVVIDDIDYDFGDLISRDHRLWSERSSRSVRHELEESSVWVKDFH